MVVMCAASVQRKSSCIAFSFDKYVCAMVSPHKAIGYVHPNEAPKQNSKNTELNPGGSKNFCHEHSSGFVTYSVVIWSRVRLRCIVFYNY